MNVIMSCVLCESTHKDLRLSKKYNGRIIDFGRHEVCHMGVGVKILPAWQTPSSESIIRER